MASMSSTFPAAQPYTYFSVASHLLTSISTSRLLNGSFRNIQCPCKARLCQITKVIPPSHLCRISIQNVCAGAFEKHPVLGQQVSRGCESKESEMSTATAPCLPKFGKCGAGRLLTATLPRRSHRVRSGRILTLSRGLSDHSVGRLSGAFDDENGRIGAPHY